MRRRILYDLCRFVSPNLFCPYPHTEVLGSVRVEHKRISVIASFVAGLRHLTSWLRLRWGCQDVKHSSLWLDCLKRKEIRALYFRNKLRWKFNQIINGSRSLRLYLRYLHFVTVAPGYSKGNHNIQWLQWWGGILWLGPTNQIKTHKRTVLRSERKWQVLSNTENW